MDRRRTESTAFAATMLIHAALLAALYVAGLLVGPRQLGPEYVEMEIVELPPPPTPPPPPVPEPEPEPEPEATPPPTPPPPSRVQPRVQPRVQAPPTPVPPAPGPVTSSDAPAPVVRLDGIAPGGIGAVPVAVGTPTGRKVGRGGTGTNTTGGGDGEPGATGAPVVAPVSIASIKQRAQPLNADIIDTRGMYTPDARRLAVEGQIKVRLVVDESGRVVQRRLLTKLGHGLDEAAMEKAQELRFEPAIDTNDRPVQSVVIWTFTFVMPE
jgi:periplasmic protein TonB